MSMQMKHSVYENLIVVNGEENGIWEPVYQAAPNVLFNNGELKRLLLNAFKK